MRHARVAAVRVLHKVPDGNDRVEAATHKRHLDCGAVTTRTKLSKRERSDDSQPERPGPQNPMNGGLGRSCLELLLRVVRRVPRGIADAPHDEYRQSNGKRDPNASVGAV